VTGACGQPIPRDYGGAESLLPARREFRQEMEVSMPQFLAACKCEPPQSGREWLRMSVLGDMACDILFGDSSPLYSRLYGDGLINGSFGGNLDILPEAAYLYLGGESQDPQTAFAEVKKEARRLGQEGIPEEFYQRVRRSCYGQAIRHLNSFEDTAVGAAEGVLFGYDPYEFPEAFASITKADLENFLRSNLAEERWALSLVYPKRETR